MNHRVMPALLALAAAGGAGSVAHAQTPQSQVAPNIAQLEQQATQLGDIEAVKRLQRAYGYYLDRSDWDNIVDLLTDDATLEYGPAGVFVGKAHARALLYAIGYGKSGLRPQQLREHVQLQPVINIAPDGHTAKGRWRAIVLLGQFHEDACCRMLHFQQAQDGLSSALSRLMVVSENYPELKATQNFRDLQAQLEGKLADQIGQPKLRAA